MYVCIINAYPSPGIPTSVLCHGAYLLWVVADEITLTRRRDRLAFSAKRAASAREDMVESTYNTYPSVSTVILGRDFSSTVD